MSLIEIPELEALHYDYAVTRRGNILFLRVAIDATQLARSINSKGTVMLPITPHCPSWGSGFRLYWDPTPTGFRRRDVPDFRLQIEWSSKTDAYQLLLVDASSGQLGDIAELGSEPIGRVLPTLPAPFYPGWAQLERAAGSHCNERTYCVFQCDLYGYDTIVEVELRP
jgi:hypothetical protein